MILISIYLSIKNVTKYKESNTLFEMKYAL